ncbi:MAG: hypothetical protein ACN2B6_00965 [Rickettsiales bacterium]
MKTVIYETLADGKLDTIESGSVVTIVEDHGDEVEISNGYLFDYIDRDNLIELGI